MVNALSLYNRRKSENDSYLKILKSRENDCLISNRNEMRSFKFC